MTKKISKRGKWRSQSTFILAAIGSAVGLGSIWRFPFVCAKNGGGAFLFAYILAMFLIGMPVLIIELSSGHKIKGSLCKVFAYINPRFEVFGWIILAIAFVITSYYVVIMGWTCKYLVDAFTLNWGNNTYLFFKQTTLEYTNDIGHMWHIKWNLLFYLFIAWIIIIVCIWKGPSSIEKIIHATIYIPAIILIIMVFRGITLEGSSIGLNYYIRPDFTKLITIKIWLAAFTQAFFSLGTGLGVMFAYGSYLPSKTNIVGNAIIITMSTTLVAFLGGLAVFGSLGFLSFKTGISLEKIANQGGVGLAFVSYPAIINNLPILNKTFGVLFFTMLLVLSLNSAFSMVEAITSSFRDKFKWSHKKSNLIISISSLTFGLLFITKGGYGWLGYFDYFASNIGIAISCIFNCLIVGWFFNTKNIIKHVESMPGPNLGKPWSISIKFIILILLFISIVSEIINGTFSFGKECPVIMDYITFSVFTILTTIAIVTNKSNNSQYI